MESTLPKSALAAGPVASKAVTLASWRLRRVTP
jgi:hypothetical protein